LPQGPPPDGPYLPKEGARGCARPPPEPGLEFAQILPEPKETSLITPPDESNFHPPTAANAFSKLQNLKRSESIATPFDCWPWPWLLPRGGHSPLNALRPCVLWLYSLAVVAARVALLVSAAHYFWLFAAAPRLLLSSLSDCRNLGLARPITAIATRRDRQWICLPWHSAHLLRSGAGRARWPLSVGSPPPFHLSTPSGEPFNW
jgi:hypothetical protein